MSTPAQKPHRSKQDYATPEAFMVAAKRRLGIDRFIHDFAADATNAKALTHFDEARDALSVEIWASYALNGWGWLNPPYTRIGPWAAKCRQMKHDGGSIAFLVPAAVGSNWFRDFVDGHARVLLLNGRIPFMPDKPKWLYPKDCILCLFSPSVAPGYEVWTWRAQQPPEGRRMSRPYVLISCECEKCIVANTQVVRIAGTARKPGAELHGTDATRYLAAQRRNTESVGEIAERLRADLLRGQQ